MEPNQQCKQYTVGWSAASSSLNKINKNRQPDLTNRKYLFSCRLVMTRDLSSTKALKLLI